MRYLLINLLFPLMLFSQDFEKPTTISIVTSPGSYDDGFSFGVQLEHQNRTIYVGPEIYHFPDLNNMTYTHLIGRVGLNAWYEIFGIQFRIYAGGRGGAVFRANSDTGAHGMLGLESGVDVALIKGIYGRISGTSDMKGDSKIWGQDSTHTVNSLIVGIGIIF